MIFFMAALLAAVMTFFCVYLLVLYSQRHQRTDIFFRLKRHKIIEEKPAAAESYPAKRLRGLLTRLADPIAERGPVQAMDAKMLQAGIPLLGGEFLILLALAALVIGIGTWMLTLDGAMALLLGALAAAALWSVVAIRIARRRRAFVEQLGDCLTTVANALRAGYSFQQAIDVISREMEPPISEEFAQVSREASRGVPLEVALEAMNSRMGSADFDLVVTAVLIQREVGGNLAQILDNISDTITERIRMKREILALTAQGRMSAWVLLILPFAIGLYLYIFNHNQLMLLFTDPMGQMALAVSLGLEVIGYFVIQRIVNIEA